MKYFSTLVVTVLYVLLLLLDLDVLSTALPQMDPSTGRPGQEEWCCVKVEVDDVVVISLNDTNANLR